MSSHGRQVRASADAVGAERRGAAVPLQPGPSGNLGWRRARQLRTHASPAADRTPGWLVIRTASARACRGWPLQLTRLAWTGPGPGTAVSSDG